MELIKKVMNYLLANPLYAIVIAVCCVAIVAVIIALCVKSSKAKTANSQPVVEEKSVDAKIVEPIKPLNELPSEVDEENSVVEINPAPTKEETVVKKQPTVDTPIVKAESAVKTEKQTPKAEKKAEPSVSNQKQSVVSKKTYSISQNETTPPIPVLTNEENEVSEVSAVTIEQTSEPTTKKSTRYNGKWIIWRLITKNNDDVQESEETYFFELLASNGEKLLSSEEYTTFSGAQKGIQTHKANIMKNNFRICLTKKGDYIFKLLNGKNFLLCTGENYPTKMRCENAIESTKRFAETAVIDENIHDLIIQLPPEDAEDAVIAPDNGYNGKWIISSAIAPDGDQIYYFELFASNGEKLLSSEEYSTYNGVISGINTHKSNIERNNFRISLTKRGDYIFKLLNANEQLLCLGEHYKTRRRCENAVESVKRFAKTAPIMDSPSVKKYSQQ